MDDDDRLHCVVELRIEPYLGRDRLRGKHQRATRQTIRLLIALGRPLELEAGTSAALETRRPTGLVMLLAREAPPSSSSRPRPITARRDRPCRRGPGSGHRPRPASRYRGRSRACASAGSGSAGVRYRSNVEETALIFLVAQRLVVRLERQAANASTSCLLRRTPADIHRSHIGRRAHPSTSP